MALPFPSMDFTPFDILTAAEMDQLVANDQALASGSGFNTASIPATAINFGGTGSGIWWQEIGRTTIASPATVMTVSSIASKKYLKLIVFTIASGGNVIPSLIFNNDNGNNYSLRVSDNGGGDGTFGSQPGITLYSASGSTTYSEIDIINISTQEKLVQVLTNHQGAAGAGNATGRRESYSKWANTTVAITRIDVNTSAANFAAGSEVIVLGHN